jgi:hypothetical protein
MRERIKDVKTNKKNVEGIKSKENKIWYDGSLYNMMRSYL